MYNQTWYILTVIDFSSGPVAYASENWFGPVTFANFFQYNLYKYSNFEVFWPVNSKV